MDLGQILLFAAGGIVFLVLIALTLRVADLRARLNALPKAEMDMVEMLGRIDADTVDIAKWSQNAEERLQRIEDLMPATLMQSSLIRYDAFPDLRGRLSRSVAVLDERGNGFVLTLLINRDDSRFFLKAVTGGVGDEPLSPEEKEAIDKARHQ